MIEKTLWTLGGTAAVLVTCALVWIRVKRAHVAEEIDKALGGLVAYQGLNR